MLPTPTLRQPDLRSRLSAVNPGWLILACCLLTIAVYFPGLSGDYMFDDRPNLLNNKWLEMDALDMDSLTGAAWSSTSGKLRRPVSMVSFALNRYAFGLDPWSYKAVNLGIHLLTGIGLWLLGRLVMRAYVRQCNPSFSRMAARWLPAIIAGLWLLHPLNLTTVLYIVQRMAGLSALFSVAGLCLYMFGRLRMQDNRAGMPYVLAGLLVFGSLAVLSKENGVLLPVFMLALEFTLFRFRDSSGRIDRRIAAFFILCAGIPAVAVLSILLLEPSMLINYNGRPFTLEERLLTEARVLAFYLKLIVMPSISELGLYHDDIPLSRGLLDPPTTLLSLLAIAGLLTTAFLLPARHALASLGILWFFTAHLLESTIIALEIAHEHRNYLADYGILLLLGFAICQLRLHKRATLIRAGSAGLFLLLLSSTTWLRANQWSDLGQHAIYEALHHPESPRAVYAAGRVYALMALNGATESEDLALEYLHKARLLDPQNIMPEATEVVLRNRLDLPVNPALFADIRRKLIEYPLSTTDISSLRALAECLDAGCNIPPEDIDELFTLALEKDRNPKLLAIYGYLRINKMRDFATGLDVFREVVERRPREAQYWVNLINLLIVMEQYQEAETQLARFRQADTYNGNEGTYRMLEDEIATARRVNTALADESAPQVNRP